MQKLTHVMKDRRLHEQALVGLESSHGCEEEDESQPDLCHSIAGRLQTCTFHRGLSVLYGV